MQIWKFKLKPSGETIVDMPYGAKIMSTAFAPAIDHEALFVWALVEPAHQKTTRCRIFAATTGMDIPPEIAGKPLIGRAAVNDGRFVVHVFLVDGEVAMGGTHG